MPSRAAVAAPCFGSTPPAACPMTVEGSHSSSFTDPPLAPAAGHYLPGNPLPYLAPSATHQPELLLLSWMIATLHTLVTDLQHHPTLTDPIPYPSSFTDQQAYRLYLQLRNTLRHLVTISTDLCQGIRILQFLPGSPGSPGHYRIDPAARFPPSATTNFLSSPILPPTHPPASISPQHSLITHLAPRARSRSRDRPPTTTATSIQSTPATTTTPDRVLCQTSLSLTAIAAHCANLYGQPLQHHRRVHHRLPRAHGRYVPALVTQALLTSSMSHLCVEFYSSEKSAPSTNRCCFFSIPFSLTSLLGILLIFSAAVSARPRPLYPIPHSRHANRPRFPRLGS